MDNQWKHSFSAEEITELESKYPKAISSLKSYLTKALSKIPKEVLEAGEMNPEEYVNMVLQMNPRALYEFFDEGEVNIIILKEGKEWMYTINGVFGSSLESRMEAEKLAFAKAFNILNDIL